MTPDERSAYVEGMGARHDWWDRNREPAIDPEREIVDAHVHFWQAQDVPDPAVPGRKLRTSRFLPGEFLAETGGHRVQGLVYIECGSGVDPSLGPRFAGVGETRFAVAQGRALSEAGGPELLAIAAHADLRDPALGEVLDAHAEAGEGRFRAIRQGGARMEDPDARLLAGFAEAGLYRDPALQAGVAALAGRGLVFEAFLFHFQLADLAELAGKAPETRIVVNHLGTPIGFGRPEGGDDAVFDTWRREIDRLAKHPNLVMKLGGVASPVTEYDGGLREVPPSSDQFVTERGRYFDAAISAFGPERCLFESNFPVDSAAISYGTLWNAFKLIAREYGTEAGDRMLAGTAREVYGAG